VIVLWSFVWVIGSWFPQEGAVENYLSRIRLLETCTVYRKAWVSGTRISFPHYARGILYILTCGGMK
jgi:hypothetical protein